MFATIINEAQIGLRDGLGREELTPLDGIWTPLFSTISRGTGDLGLQLPEVCREKEC